MNWEPLVWDFKGNATEEQAALIEFGNNGWELLAVVALPLCRRAYFKRPKPEISTPSTDTTEWEYKAVEAKDFEDLQLHGTNGWEAVCALPDSQSILMKRPKKKTSEGSENIPNPLCTQEQLKRAQEETGDILRELTKDAAKIGEELEDLHAPDNSVDGMVFGDESDNPAPPAEPSHYTSDGPPAGPEDRPAYNAWRKTHPKATLGDK